MTYEEWQSRDALGRVTQFRNAIRVHITALDREPEREE